MGKPKKETVRKLRGLMILDQMEDYTPLHKLHNLSNELEVQYLGQDLVDRTWDIAKIFLCDCDCCKNRRNEKKRDFEGNESHEK